MKNGAGYFAAAGLIALWAVSCGKAADKAATPRPSGDSVGEGASSVPAIAPPARPTRPRQACEYELSTASPLQTALPDATAGGQGSDISIVTVGDCKPLGSIWYIPSLKMLVGDRNIAVLPHDMAADFCRDQFKPNVFENDEVMAPMPLNWRLPSKEEYLALSALRDRLPHIRDHWYWSSTPLDRFEERFWGFGGDSDNSEIFLSTDALASVRCVSSLP